MKSKTFPSKAGAIAVLLLAASIGALAQSSVAKNKV